jgi:hypothetical protein
MINWLEHPKDSNFDAALSYLTLLLGAEKAKRFVKKLRSGIVEEFLVKDILRAAHTQALSHKIDHVASNTKKITDKEAISPVLLCRYKGHLIIADGMHRISAIWHKGEDNKVHAIVV